jgi:hypothetical protein
MDENLTIRKVKDLQIQPNNFYIQGKNFIVSSKDYGIKIFNLDNFNLIKDLPNLGKDIDNPYSSDGSTINYTSVGDLKVYFLSNNFTDGVTSNTYSIVDEDTINEGCFIATAAYGSYFQKHVKVLRDFRDKYLLTNSIGRKFVHLYYKYSPSIASEIAKSEVAKSIVRAVLTPIVYIIKYPLYSFFIISLFIFLAIKRGSLFKTTKAVSI